MRPDAPLGFFVVGGVILILTGVLQAVVRLPGRGQRGLARALNRGTAWALFCVAFGVAAILVGTGTLRFP